MTHDCARRGYVLIELVVVLVLISIVASATIFSLRTPVQNARLKRLLTSLEDADERARMEAKRSGATVELTIDSAKRIASQTIIKGRQRIKSERSIAFSGGLHIDQFTTKSKTLNDDVFTVRIEPSGCSDTYGLRLSSNRNDGDSHQTWLVVVGATGQYLRTNEDADVAAIVNAQR